MYAPVPRADIELTVNKSDEPNAMLPRFEYVSFWELSAVILTTFAESWTGESKVAVKALDDKALRVIPEFVEVKVLPVDVTVRTEELVE